MLSIAMISALLAGVSQSSTCPSTACVCARVALAGPPASDSKETVFIGQAVAVLADSAWVPTSTWARDSANVPAFQGRVILTVEEGWSGTPRPLRTKRNEGLCGRGHDRPQLMRRSLDGRTWLFERSA